MDDNSKTTEQLPPVDMVTSSDRRSYSFLLSMSKRMGRVATKSFVEVREFLQKEITMTPSERFMAGMPKISLHKPSKPRDIAKGLRAIRKHRAGSTRRSGDEELDSSQKNLKRIIEQSHEILASANTVFPITLFPDTVFVDRTKVTIIRRDFFWSSDTVSIRIEDVLNVSTTLGPLFGSLTIASRVMSTTDHFRIDHFWRNDVIHLKHIIQGYVIARHSKIDTAHLSKDELVRTLVEIGHDTNR